jgi:hypothetical protein
MKSVKSCLFVIGCILVSLCSHARAACLPLLFGQTVTGTINSAAQTNCYTFTANANDLVDFTLVATSGTLSPKIQLYSSAGKLLSSANPAYCNGSTIEMNTVTLPASDVYTVFVSDCSDTNTGNYALYSQRTNNPSGAANLSFGQTETGTIGSAAQSNTYSFNANANDIVDFTMTATSGSLSPKIRLYNPAGTLLSSANPGYCNGSTIEMNTVTLPASGTYTVLVGDCSDTKAGSYVIYSQRTDNACCGAANLVFGQTQTGTIGSAAQSNTYSFSANANDIVDFTMTASGSLSPKIRLYNPGGTLLSSANPGYCNGSTIEMNTVTLPTSGTYIVLVGDCSDTNTGNYAIYSQRTNNPSGAANLPFGQTQTGSISSAAQSNTYTFSANANDVVDFTMTATSGSLSPKIRLYIPAGTLLKSANPGYCNGFTIEMNTVTLPASGTYTVLVGDCSDTNAGNYAIYAQRTNNPVPSIALLWGQVQPGTIGSAAQSDSYTFPGIANDVVDFTITAKTGSLSPKIRLYNPGGTLFNSANPGYCNGSTIEMNSVTLPTSGTYTVLVGDCSDTNTGNYNLSSQCFGTCPLPAPAPALTSLSPTSALAGGGGFTLTVNGSNFVSGPNSVVYWNGSSRVTTYVSSTQLTAAILASDIATPGTFPVTVLNPNPLIGPSNAITFTVNTLLDWAGNGRSGALLYAPTTGDAYTAMSNGNGTYTYVPNIFTPGFDTIRSGDFNGDGKADLVVYNSTNALAYIGFGNGNGDGTFNFQSLFWSPLYNIVETGDINGDGKTDVALYNSTTGTLYTGISNGDGTFSYQYHLVSKNFTFVRLADFNGDGKADLMLYNSTNGLAFLGVGDGTGNFTFHALNVSSGYALADTGDLNGDGKADLILYNPTNGNAATGISDGQGGFAFTPLVFSPGFTSVRLAAYTGRATADVTVYNKNTGGAYFGTGTGTGNFNFQSLFWSPGYDYVVPEDVNGDGKTDIVLYNSATGTEYTGISNANGTFTYTYTYWGPGRVLAH